VYESFLTKKTGVMKTYQISVLSLVALGMMATISKKHPLAHWEAAKDYVEVPAGFAYVEEQKQEVEAFYISRYEVSNAQYQSFLEDLKAQGKEKAYHAALPVLQQPASWKKTPLAEGFMIPQYHSYKGFADFPVMGITSEAAQQYCAWLSEKAAAQTDGAYEIQFRLPTQAEWIRAARGETQNEYAWGGPYLQKGNGYYRCNFKRISAEKVTFNAETNSYEIVPPPADDTEGNMTDKVNTYDANDFGLHHMCGNVAEMISEKGKALGGSWNDTGYDVRVESVSEYQEASPYVGFRPVMVVKR
jgi:formylglycine-generating enzyme required for sulfatase activity